MVYIHLRVHLRLGKKCLLQLLLLLLLLSTTTRHFLPNQRCTLRCKYTIYCQKVRDYLKIFHCIDALLEHFRLSNYSFVNKMFVCAHGLFVCLFACLFSCLTATVYSQIMSYLSVILTLKSCHTRTAISRRSRKIQNAEVSVVRTPPTP